MHSLPQIGTRSDRVHRQLCSHGSVPHPYQGTYYLPVWIDALDTFETCSRVSVSTLSLTALTDVMRRNCDAISVFAKTNVEYVIAVECDNLPSNAAIDGLSVLSRGIVHGITTRRWPVS
jgi:hypothetical protein